MRHVRARSLFCPLASSARAMTPCALGEPPCGRLSLLLRSSGKAQPAAVLLHRQAPTRLRLVAVVAVRARLGALCALIFLGASLRVGASSTRDAQRPS